MPKIKQLSQQEAQKIAAGQVVERPANVVKELLENSIDAGATQISVYIEDGGKQLIRIVDNGCGMDKEDAQLCFSKHATSKITSMDELDLNYYLWISWRSTCKYCSSKQSNFDYQKADTHEGIKLEITEGNFSNQ